MVFGLNMLTDVIGGVAIGLGVGLLLMAAQPEIPEKEPYVCKSVSGDKYHVTDYDVVGTLVIDNISGQLFDSWYCIPFEGNDVNYTKDKQ